MCLAVYAGQTSRPLETQLKEHKDAMKHAKTEHVWKGNHQLDFQRTFVLAQELDTSQQCLLESWFIQSKRHTLNREAGSLAPVYSSIFLFFYAFCFVVIYIFLLCSVLLWLLLFWVVLSHCSTLPLLYRVSSHHYVNIPFSLFPGLPGNVVVCLLLLESWFCSVPWLLGDVFVCSIMFLSCCWCINSHCIASVYTCHWWGSQNGDRNVWQQSCFLATSYRLVYVRDGTVVGGQRRGKFGKFNHSRRMI